MTMSKKTAFALVFIVLFIVNIAAFTSDIEVNLFNTQTLPLPTGITELSTTNGYSSSVQITGSNNYFQIRIVSKLLLKLF